MIAHLRGTVAKLSPGHITVDVQGVGYGVQVPMSDWDTLQDDQQLTLHILTYVREDKLSLYGFTQVGTKQLFAELIELAGIGPRMGLELCDVPRNILARAIHDHDATLLTSIKGIGKKSAEKLLVELSSLAERHPHIFVSEGGGVAKAAFDQDTIEALSQLGFAKPDIMRALDSLDTELTTTEQRVGAALRVL